MIIHGMPIADYHTSAPAWMSKTTLRHFEDYGPKWFKRFLDGKAKPRTPGGVEQGLALDCLLTEGHAVYDARYVVRPEGIDLRTKDGKAWRESCGDKEILTTEDSAILADAAEAVRESIAWPWINSQHTQAQATIRRDSAGLGFGLQSRPDWLMIDGQEAVVIDLKKTRDLSRFGTQAIDLGYHLQAAMARWCLAGYGITMSAAYLVAVEWEHAARCKVYRIPDDVLDYADSRMRRIAAEIGRRMMCNDWTERQDEAEELDVPGWLMARMEADHA